MHWLGNTNSAANFHDLVSILTNSFQSKMWTTYCVTIYQTEVYYNNADVFIDFHVTLDQELYALSCVALFPQRTKPSLNFFNSSSIINQQPSLETTLVNHIFSLLQDIRHSLSVYFGQGPINSDSFHIFIVQFSEDSIIGNLAYQNWWGRLNIDCPPIYFNQLLENVLAHPDSSELDCWNMLGRTVVETQRALVRSISILTRLRLINSPTVS